MTWEGLTFIGTITKTLSFFFKLTRNVQMIKIHVHSCTYDVQSEYINDYTICARGGANFTDLNFRRICRRQAILPQTPPPI